MNSSSETRVRLAARMYECRDACRRIAGDGYAARLADGKRLVSGLATAWNCDVIAVLPRIQRECKRDRKPLDALAIMWLTAATVEVIEAG